MDNEMKKIMLEIFSSKQKGFKIKSMKKIQKKIVKLEVGREFLVKKA